MKASICSRITVVLLAPAMVFLFCSALAAQDNAPNPKVELFTGYSYWNPGGQLNGVNAKDIFGGFGVSGTYNFTKYLGATADFGGHFGGTGLNRADAFTFLFGPKLTLPGAEHFRPFLEGLVGVVKLDPSQIAPDKTTFGAAAGGGIDLPFTNHFAVRLIQADYIYQNYGRDKITPGSGRWNSARIQGGVVFLFGGEKPLPPPTAACSVEPTAVNAGEPVTANISAQGFNSKHTVTYKWQSTGGKLTESGATASIDTAGLTPGSYTVTANATDPQIKKNNSAECRADFTINQPPPPPQHPPTISCSPNPAEVKSGDPSTITCEAASPDNRPLTTDCTTSAGHISGSGTSYTLDTAGAPAGPISVNCTTTDDRGLNASTSTTVTVQAPPAPPQASKIGEITFPNKMKPARVDNTAKAILDDVALRLQRDADAKAVIVGYFDPSEKGGDKLAQQRAVNTKAYLTTEKGIDPARIEVRTGTAGGNRAEIYLVPAGATFNEPGTTAFDESKVKAQVDHARGGARAPRARKAGKATPKP